MIILNDLDKWAIISPMLDHSKFTKNASLNDPNSQNEFFGHFLEFCASDLLKIAYFDFTK